MSEAIERKNFKSTYKADITDGRIDIEETTVFLQSDLSRYILSFAIGLILTLLIELLIAKAFCGYIKRRNRQNRLLIFTAIANIITLPFVWFVFPMLRSTKLAMILGELFAFVFEAGFIYYFNRELITLKKSILLSFIMNWVSFILGIVFFIIFWAAFINLRLDFPFFPLV